MLRRRNRPAKINAPTTLADVINIPIGNLNHHVSRHNALATEPGMQRKSGSLFEAVRFIVVHLGKIAVRVRFHNHMAGSASVVAATSVLQVKSEVHRDIQQRFRLSMLPVWQFPGLKVVLDIGGKEGYFRHII